MTITTASRENGTIRVTLDGPVTIYEAVAFKRELLAALEQAHRMEIDMAGVDEIDTAGVQLLMLARREAAREGKEICLAPKSEAVVEVLDRYSLASCFEQAAQPTAARPVPAAMEPSCDCPGSLAEESPR